MSGSAPEDSGFPATLDHVDAIHRIAESFGFMPGFVGTLCIAFGLVILLAPGLNPPPALAAGAAGLIVAGALLWWYEVRRRGRRTVLVPRNSLVGIYRNSERDEIVGPDTVLPYKLHWVNTFKVVGMPLAFGLMIVGAFIVTIATRPIQSDDWGLLVFGSLFLIGAASGIRTRILLKHFYIPNGKTRQEIMLSSADERRLFGRA
jgi:hypothetical protein